MKKVLICLLLTVLLTVAMAVLHHFFSLDVYWYVSAALALLLAHGVLYGTLCMRLAARKGHDRYFWTGFFWGFAGLVYVVGLPLRRRSRYEE